MLDQNQVKVLDQIQFISEVGRDTVQYVQWNTIPFLLFSSHYLIVDIHKKLGYVDIWASVVFSCILEHQTMSSVMLQLCVLLAAIPS